VATGYYRDGGTLEMAYRTLRRAIEGKVDVWFYSWVPQSVADFRRDPALAQQLEAVQILFWEADYIEDCAQAAELKRVKAESARGQLRNLNRKTEEGWGLISRPRARPLGYGRTNR